MKSELKILLVEDSDTFRSEVVRFLGVYNEIDDVPDLKSARIALQKRGYGVVILDKGLPDGSGIDLIPEIKAQNPNAVIIVLTADNELSSVKKCILAGADDYVVKSENAISDLLVRIPFVVERSAERRQLDCLKEQVRAAFKYELIGKSASTAELRATVLGLRGSGSHVLITGESGTGKELVARRLNAIEDGRARPFVAINCSAIPENLIESDLFGHKKGAFTGATSDKPGKFELAHNGDLFLDEIAELPLAAQAKILRVIQDGQFFRVGGSAPVEVSCRIIAATNKDIENMVRTGEFREDLYYRLNVVRVKTTPLRMRAGDIADLASLFCLQIGGPSVKISDRSIQKLDQHPWPGNIRELRNVIERAVIRARQRRTDTIDLEDISIDQMQGTVSDFRKLEASLPADISELSEQGFREYMESAERLYLTKVMDLTNGNAVECGVRIGLARSTIFQKLYALGIPRRTYQDKKSIKGPTGLTRSNKKYNDQNFGGENG